MMYAKASLMTTSVLFRRRWTFLLLLCSAAFFVLLFLASDVVDAVKVAPRSCGGSVRHVHLSVGRDPSTSMIVSFATIPSYYGDDVDVDGMRNSRPEPPVGGVLVGTSPSHLDMIFLQDEGEEASHYNLTSPRRGNFVHPGDGRKDESRYFSPYYHHVTASGLKPLTTYYYKPIVKPNRKGFDELIRNRGNLRTEKELAMLQTLQDVQDREQEEHDSGRRQLEIGRRRLVQWGPYDGSERACPSPDKIRTFRTAPPPSPDGGGGVGVNFCVVGDIGQFPHSEETLSRIIRSRNEIDAILLAGDIAYTTGDHRRWDTFFDFLDDYPVTEHIPIQIVPGNHDIDKEDNSSAIFQAYEHRFRMPRVESPRLGQYDGPLGPLNMDRPPYPLPYEYGNAYYAFTYGSARVVMISSYSSMEPNSTQYGWLVREFESLDRAETPWLLAVLHTPIYNTFSLHQKDYQILAAKEHLEPLFVKYRVNVVFTGHIHAYQRTTNVAFDEPHPSGPVHITVGAGGRKCEAPFKSEVPEPWIRARDATIYGYGMFRIRNSTHAEWHWIHTGHNDERSYNELWKSNATLPPGPGQDRVYIENQALRS